MKGEDAKAIVAQGYDRIGDAYVARFGRSSVRDAKLAWLLKKLPAEAMVLDLGCGTGEPVARKLVAHGCQVTGVDASVEVIIRARRHVPEATFVHADMTSVQLPPRSFDAITAFYSIAHVPRDEQQALIRRIATWLRPNGLFIASFGSSEGDWLGEWLGTPMFFSHLDPDETRQIVSDAGFCIEQAELLKQDNEAATFL